MSVMIDLFNALDAFREAGPRCFVKGHAPTIYVVSSIDYIYPSCGDHLTSAIREVSYQYSPPIDNVQVFWRP